MTERSSDLPNYDNWLEKPYIEAASQAAAYEAYDESDSANEDFSNWMATLVPDELPDELYNQLWNHWHNTADYARTFLAWADDDGDEPDEDPYDDDARHEWADREYE